jgi:hypothetical protein
MNSKQHGPAWIAILILPSSAALCAQDLSGGSDDAGWVRAWMRTAERARASQPHFVAPIFTTHVMLVQQFRYDMSWAGSERSYDHF